MASFLQRKGGKSRTDSMAGDDRDRETRDRGWAKLKSVVVPEGKGGLHAMPSGCTGR